MMGYKVDRRELKMNTVVPTNYCPKTAAEALKLVAVTTFKPFTQNDWDAFNGCTSEQPMIGTVDFANGRKDGDNYCVIIILDGAHLEFSQSYVIEDEDDGREHLEYYWSQFDLADPTRDNCSWL